MTKFSNPEEKEEHYPFLSPRLPKQMNTNTQEYPVIMPICICEKTVLLKVVGGRGRSVGRDVIERRRLRSRVGMEGESRRRHSHSPTSIPAANF